MEGQHTAALFPTPCELLYRGQDDAAWELEPSTLRQKPLAKANALPEIFRTKKRSYEGLFNQRRPVYHLSP
jgi:hypothetical protein